MPNIFLPIDKNGYFINTLSISEVQPIYQEIIPSLIASYKNIFQENLLSIYVRGSVANGNATPYISDFDSVAIIFSVDALITKEELAKNNKHLSEQFPYVTKFDSKHFTISQLFNDSAFKSYQFIIKCQSICIFGEDISERIKKFMPNNDVIENLPLLKTRIERINKKFDRKLTSEEIKQICSSIMKSIVRAGFELCIEKEKCFTKDLMHCFRIFSKHYASQKGEMNMAFELAISPTDNKRKIKEIFNVLGIWLICSFESK